MLFFAVSSSMPLRQIWFAMQEKLLKLQEIFWKKKHYQISNSKIPNPLYQMPSKLLFELRCLCGFRLCLCLCLSAKKKLFNGCRYQKMLVYKVVTFLKRIKMAVLFFDFFGSDPSKMDQTWSNLIKLDLSPI